MSNLVVNLHFPSKIDHKLMVNPGKFTIFGLPKSSKASPLIDQPSPGVPSRFPPAFPPDAASCWHPLHGPVSELH